MDKLLKAREILSSLKYEKKISLREIQSVIGFLIFACMVVPPGRAFLRRLMDLSTKISNPYHYVRLNKEARADLAAW